MIVHKKRPNRWHRDGVSVVKYDRELIRQSLDASELVTELGWALGTIEDQLSFGLDPESAALARDRRVKSVLREAIEQVSKLEERLDLAKSALKRVAEFGHNFDNPNCCPDAPVYECGCYEISQWDIAKKALDEIGEK